MQRCELSVMLVISKRGVIQIDIGSHKHIDDLQLVMIR